ncbi:CaiB/BaiF CoA transferase family protein [Bordetella petrii]|uniref:CaiB/BaiF CoA transferase family protein n=1 Tax=Bordetella petrii TaxID=94624 RepID=UPI001E2BEA94|nr:CaiB/BaiF CoA-transferase family protein [Bordetella petrii]MCD0505090.1 CoA transferase [Bordetella petrii]
MLSRALDNIRVLDLSRILAGPWCTQNLADLGADVIKVERPGQGDDTRKWGPPYLQSRDGQDTLSAYFTCCNRNKRSICLDFSLPEGQQALRELVLGADVLVENYKSGTLKRYGLDYDSLKALRPELVYVSITGYGQSGPKARQPGYDYIFQGMGGLMSHTGVPDGEPGGGPLRAGIPVVDISTGMYATSAILAALMQRARTGQGSYLDIALLDVAVAINANQAANYLVSGHSPQRSGNAHPNLAPYEVFRARDGFFILAVGNDNQFAKLCALCGVPELAQQERYATNAARVQNLPALRQILSDIIARQDRGHWTAGLEQAGIAWGPVNDLDDVFADEQVRHRGLLQHARHERFGDVPLVRNPMLAGEPAAPLRPPPLAGEHTHEILGKA